MGATAEDNIAELINHICEEVLLYSDSSILGKLFPYIMEICKYPAKYRDEHLQQAATLTLIRFMTVSSRFCEAHMSFLMNILNHTKNIKIKCNIVVGLSDLTFRFPNIIEPWTGHFYSTLHEENNELRLTAVKMLSHLILHEMIRVKGQIADLAMCIVDQSEEIRNITEQFFKEIAHKSNILYNVLPDIISKLSDASLNLEEEKYHVIMKYILGLIQKDRQVETLIEKLCLRFPVTREERQWRDIAYCLSLLSYNEKSIRKLLDNIQHYKDKVQIDEVYQSFKLIISNTSKMAKPELKAAVTELETRINECLEVRSNVEGGETEEGAEGATQTQKETTGNKTRTDRAKASGSKKAVNKKNANKSRRKGKASKSLDKSLEDASSLDDVSSADESPTVQKSNKKGGNTTAKSGNRKKRASSSESASSSEQEVIPKQTKGRAAAKKQTAAAPTSLGSGRSRVIEESASSNEEETPQRKRWRNNRK